MLGDDDFFHRVHKTNKRKLIHSKKKNKQTTEGTFNDGAHLLWILLDKALDTKCVFSLGCNGVVTGREQILESRFSLNDIYINLICRSKYSLIAKASYFIC